jgi:DNA end-binding protein Ku
MLVPDLFASIASNTGSGQLTFRAEHRTTVDVRRSVAFRGQCRHAQLEAAMVGRPYWSGQLRISLVSFGIQLYPATNSAAGIAFHQIDRATGKRVRHLNVIDDDQPVDNSEIVKGFEYSKGKYLIVEPDEVKKLRLETKSTIEVSQFIDSKELPPYLFEKPYFVVPDTKGSSEAFAVVRTAMAQTDKIAIGEIAFGGREHLIAIAAPTDPGARGLMAYTLRYAEELRDSKECFSGIEAHTIDKKHLQLASELIRAQSSPFQLDSFKDDYEAALRELIEAKHTSTPLPISEEKPQRGKVVGLMDALRRSVNESKRSDEPRKTTSRQPPKKGPALVKPAKRGHRAA